MCAVSRVKSKRFHGKANPEGFFFIPDRLLTSRTRGYSTGTRIFWFRFWISHPCHTAAILSRGNKKALFYHAKPHPHGFHCEAWRGKTKLFWSPGTIWPPCDKGEFQSLLHPFRWTRVTVSLGARLSLLSPTRTPDGACTVDNSHRGVLILERIRISGVDGQI